jgi:DNA-directed RNA polymerase subunit RPC12/RpoP
MMEIDHIYTNEIVCPHCGHKYRDSWECGTDEAGGECDWEETCCECGAEFYASRYIAVSYSTRKINEGTES